MKIVQFLASKGWGGLENIFVDICNELAVENEVSVILFKDSHIEPYLNNKIKIYNLTSGTSRFNPLLYIELFKIINLIKPDIVHTHSAKATEIFYKINKFLNLTHIGTKHNLSKGTIFNKIKYPTAVSKDVAKTIRNKNVKIIYNGITPIKIKKIKDKNNKIFHILAIGRLDKIKGFDILIKECSKIKFDFKLDIIGDGQERENLNTLITSLNLDKKIKLIGFKTDIPKRMSNADIVVVSSHSEGFSLVVLESLFYANMLISTNVGISSEILPSEFIIDDFNIATKIENIYDYYGTFKSEFFKFSEAYRLKFSIKNIVDEYVKYYDFLLDRELNKTLI